MKNKKMTLIEMLHNIDFGNPDGLHDRNLIDYFIDNNYWNEIIESDIFYIVGRKGTGKSAIYKWLLTQQGLKETLIHNTSFTRFPFEKLLKLEDADFTRPNQFQSIWYYMILTSFCKLIVVDDREKPITETWKEIAEYVDFRFGRDAKELHSTIATKVKSTELGLSIANFGPKTSSSNSLTYSLSETENIREVNERLEYLVLNYFSESGLSYILQFDQLDDNYTLYLQDGRYFEAIISLFKIIYHFNNLAKGYSNNSKVIAYIRSDIYIRFNSFDPDSSKFDYHTYELSWVIRDRVDFNNPDLKKLINYRIKNSIETNLPDPFKYIFDSKRLGIKDRGSLKNPFIYMLNRSYHRPRDIIQFCLKIQRVSKKSKGFDRNCIFKAEKLFSDWLLKELSNEIAPLLGNDTKPWYSFLRNFSTKAFPFSFFNDLYYLNDMHNITPNRKAEDVLSILYSVGIIVNLVKKDNGGFEYYDIIKYPNSEVDLDRRLAIHKGLHKGLNLSNRV